MSILISELDDTFHAIKETIEKYNQLVEFLLQEIHQRQHVCTTNHAVLLDNAKALLIKFGELHPIP